MKHKTFAIVHNIPSPYRLHLFRVLDKCLKSRGFYFHVHFMARSQSDRPKQWLPKDKDLTFGHTFWRDASPMHLHFNPGLIAHVITRPPDFIMLCGVWDSFTNALLSLLPKQSKRIVWIEVNTKSPGIIKGIVGIVKRTLLHRSDIITVPGREGIEYLKLLFGKSHKFSNIAILPNIIDETLFIPRWEFPDIERNQIRTKFNISNRERWAIWPARLISTKGIIEFIEKLPLDIICDWKITILGRGPLENKIRNLLLKKYLQKNIEIFPYVAYTEMPAIYASSDLFLLPSLSDPNPLSVIEALHSGLPILLSNQVGNYPEALKEGINGWGLNPYDHHSVIKALNLAFGSDNDTLKKMGMISKEIAVNLWNSNDAVNNFLDTVLA